MKVCIYVDLNKQLKECLFFRHSVNCGHEKERILEVGKT